MDATFYHIPSERTVDGWRDRTPARFVFSAKVPQAITHEKVLVGCEEERAAFLRVMERLGDKLGPLLFQFRYFNKGDFPGPDPFLDRLETFLPTLPDRHRYAVEVRNRKFVTTRLLDLLHRHRVALALIDHPWFDPIDRLMERPGVLTADFAYLRWLGDRRGIEEATTTWDRLIVDRSAEMGRWIPAIRTMLSRDRYAGYAIGSIERFRELWGGEG